MQGEIAVGIVLFNPDNEDRVQKGLTSILKQVERVYIFDNSTKKHSITFPTKVIYITENENKGIAYALNRIVEKAEADGYTWVVTMDQDSVMPNGLIKAYEEHIHDNTIGIICPQVIDSRRSYMEIKREPAEEFINYCITSASCTNLEGWKCVGGFDEWLFIDLVDNDFCKRIIASEYKILRLNNLVLDQEFGKIIPKGERVQKFWNREAKTLHNDNFGKLGYSKSVSPMRVYYTCRNILYVNKKLKRYGKTGYKENYNCNGFVGFLICFVFPSIFRSNKKITIVKNVLKGFVDGKNKSVEIWEANNE